ncbi:hypothetical protein, partial [Raoultella terrigena]|uniref:hypothetical protein n=1 Tax=Raoultella terrigena TaxID=577 RepID=UPI00349FC121
GGQDARHKLPGIKQTKKPHAQAWGFLLSAVQEKRSDAARSPPAICTSDKYNAFPPLILYLKYQSSLF